MHRALDEAEAAARAKARADLLWILKFCGLVLLCGWGLEAAGAWLVFVVLGTG